MKIIFFLLHFTAVIFLVIVGAPIVLYREFKWRRSPQYAFALKMQSLQKQYDAEVAEQVHKNMTPGKSMLVAARLADDPRYQEFIKHKTAYMCIMDICMELLPKDIFRKNEFVILYFAKMAHGFVTGQYNERPTCEMFTRVRTVGDLLCLLVQLKVVTKEIFMDRFTGVDGKVLREYLLIEIANYDDPTLACKRYQEPGPCGY